MGIFKKPWVVVLIGSAVVYALASNFLKSATLPLDVVVAKYDLNAGVRLTEDLLETQEMAARFIPDGAFTSIDDALGLVLTSSRVAGDYITNYVAGDGEAASGIPSQLAADHVAIAVKIDQATGILGTIRPGQLVTVIGIIDPARLAIESNSESKAQTISGGEIIVSDPISAEELATRNSEEEDNQVPFSPAAGIALTGIEVLVVPQGFRYEELPTIQGDEEALFNNARNTLAGQEGSVVVLSVPITPIEFTEGYFVSPVTLLALLNEAGIIHLVLESAKADMETTIVGLPNLDMATLYQELTGFDLNK